MSRRGSNACAGFCDDPSLTGCEIRPRTAPGCFGWVSERPLRRQVDSDHLTIALITANLVGIGLAIAVRK